MVMFVNIIKFFGTSDFNAGVDTGRVSDAVFWFWFKVIEGAELVVANNSNQKQCSSWLEKARPMS